VKRSAPFIAAAVAIVVAVLVIFLVVLPKMGEISQTQEQLQAAQDDEISLEAQLRSLQQAEAEAPDNEAAIASIQDQVPPTADLPALIRLLQGAADQAAVDFFSFTPSPPTTDPSGTYSVINSSIVVTGSYFAIDEYLFLLETLPRAAKVTTIAVTPGAAASADGTPTSTGSLQLNVTVEFYTTDTSAGPGSVPGQSTGSVTVPGA